MPRKARKMSPSNIYHVVIKGLDRQLLFEERNDYLKYLEILQENKITCEFLVYAYCLMSNHVHLIIQVTSTPLETIFRKINTAYALWYNNKYDRTGRLLNGRYFSEPIDTTSYLLTAVRYIHQNPMKAGLEQSPGEKYIWSSFKEYFKKKPSLVDKNFILELIGGLEEFEKYQRMENDDSFPDIDSVHHHLTDSTALEIAISESGCKSASDFQLLDINNLIDQIKKLHKKGISIRQLNRLTGIPKGKIERLLKF